MLGNTSQEQKSENRTEINTSSAGEEKKKQGACKNLIFDFSQAEDICIALLGYETAALGRQLILFYMVIE